MQIAKHQVADADEIAFAFGLIDGAKEVRTVTAAGGEERRIGQRDGRNAQASDLERRLWTRLVGAKVSAHCGARRACRNRAQPGSSIDSHGNLPRIGLCKTATRVNLCDWFDTTRRDVEYNSVRLELSLSNRYNLLR